MVVIHMNSRNTPYRLILFNCLSIITYRTCMQKPEKSTSSPKAIHALFICSIYVLIISLFGKGRKNMALLYTLFVNLHEEFIRKTEKKC